MKKLIIMVLGVFSALPALARDFTYEYEGQTLKYTVISEEEKTVMTKEGGFNTPGNNVSGELVIPEIVKEGDVEYTVTSIGEASFDRCTSLTSVTIPNSVTSIDYRAFNCCSSLTSVIIPNSVTSIGFSAFFGCSGLILLTIPNSVTSIDGWAFFGCSGLTSLTIPNSVTSIGNYAFGDCTDLTVVTIGNSVTSIGTGAFYNCSGLKKAEFTSVEQLCRIEFDNSGANPLSYAHNLYINGEQITDLFIPNSVTSIGNYAFFSYSSLISVTIPNSVTSIGIRSFMGCSGLTSLTIPNSVTSIGNYAFSHCYDLTYVYYNTVDPINSDADFFSTLTYQDATLYVPEVAVEKCKNIYPWNKFKNIQAFDFSGIEEIKAPLDTDAPYEVYNISGVKAGACIDALTPGIYIVRQGNTVKKISVK